MATAPKKSKRYRYNLESVLKVRAIREKQEQDLYAKALQTVEDEKQKVKKLQQQERENYDILLELMTGRVQDVNGIMMRKFHLERLKEQIVEQEQVVIEAEKAAEEQRQKLVVAMRDKKLMEKDKEKKKLAWRKFMDKEDGKFLDDIATIGYQHRKRDAHDDA